MKTDWNSHYRKEKSFLSYPDENLVRLLSSELKRYQNPSMLRALDIGCGSGRHITLLKNSGIYDVFGSDNSMNALKICRDKNIKFLVNCENKNLSFGNNSFDLTIAWGSLHYTDKSGIVPMISEINRITKIGGALFATLRRDNDTYLKNGRHLGNNTWQTGLDDLTGTIVSFYSEDELKIIFSGFSELKYGWMERTIVGDTSKIISHWIIAARK